MHTLTPWRMLPPGGAPITREGLRQAFHAARQGPEAPHAHGALYALRTLLAARFEVEHVVLCGSGREGLALICETLRRNRPGLNQVLIPAYVSYSVPSAVVRAGCRVALYDVDPSTLAPDLDSLDRALEAHKEHLLAVVACHQFGIPFDLTPLAERCSAYGLPLVDDAAQTMGATVNGRNAGCMGDVGLFSLSRSKPLTSVNGGIVISNNAELARSLAQPPGGSSIASDAPDSLVSLKAAILALLRKPLLYRLPASVPWLKLGESIFDPWFSCPAFSTFQAGLAAWGLAHLEAINTERKGKARLYAEQIHTLPHMRPVQPQNGSEAIYVRFPVMPENADGWAGTHPAASREAVRCGISRGFPQALNAVTALKPYLTPASIPLKSTPGAARLAKDLITLPTHDDVREDDIAAVLACLTATCKGSA